MRSEMRPLQAPRPRGPLSAWVLDRMCGAFVPPAPGASPGSGFGPDLQLALYLCYESHYGSIPGVDDDHEWTPEIIAFRRQLEIAFESALLDAAGNGPHPGVPVRDAIRDIISADASPSVSRHIETVGTLSEVRDVVLHRSAYQLKEGDGHTSAVPRLDGRAKQLLVAIQAGEYGADAPGRSMHSELFAQTMRGLGMDARPNAYLDVLPASALMVSNLISMFGMNRRWRGALVGHLAVFEMTSVVPMGRYARGLERLGVDAATRRFYDVHVLADAEHEVLALDMADTLATSNPDLADDILFGARCATVVEMQFATTLFDGWASRRRDRAAA